MRSPTGFPTTDMDFCSERRGRLSARQRTFHLAAGVPEIMVERGGFGLRSSAIRRSWVVAESAAYSAATTCDG